MKKVTSAIGEVVFEASSKHRTAGSLVKSPWKCGRVINPSQVRRSSSPGGRDSAKSPRKHLCHGDSHGTLSDASEEQWLVSGEQVTK